MRSEGYCSCRVCVCVCLSVKSHLTYGASVRPENAVTYSAGNEGQKICGVFSETAPLQRSSTPSVVRPCVQSAIFTCSCTRMRISRAHDTPPRVQHFSAFHLLNSVPVRGHVPMHAHNMWLRVLARQNVVKRILKRTPIHVGLYIISCVYCIVQDAHTDGQDSWLGRCMYMYMKY